ncbi:lipopolysaccharide biosynthesis protein [Olsenella sp. YH-ols2217]|uniref:Lipopolysaccharide biosynthesis protein n=1 Tax=Kribbibacterium absianum TaxID=3044210 RepID=A0ABT6ZM95_9ACTN|nr:MULTISPECIES: lipopolysaccharide biosynthesis protein [unclassified Olsenella]MDJ1122167.1 lipopolysaccharide biosynthesis protein [Olsenella sp. YH-ols2216]MDJ1130175.1 lipopolysaccharide biosynthesis protein [Olsenella sp. YH-ols2217]
MSTKQPVSFKGAAIIQFVSKYATVAIQLVITAILSRLISPEAFGEVAIVTVFTSFFAVFSDMGIGAAIVQFRDLTVKDYEKVFTFSLLLALALGVLFCGISPLIAFFYDDDGLVPLLLASAPSLVFNTLNMVPNGLMLRDKRFREIGFRLVVCTVVSGAVASAAALLGLGAYALVFQTVLSALLTFVWNLWLSPLRRLDIHFMGPLREIFSYSSFQFGFTTVNYFSRNLDNLLIGKFFGDAQLGYYSKSYSLTTYPMSMFSSLISGIVQPYMAEHQDEPSYIFAFWRKLTKLISLIGAPIAACLVVCASEIIAIMYGPQWAASVPLFQALSFSVYTQMLGNSTGGFYQSIGRTDLMFRVGLINTGITLAGLAVGIVSGSLQTIADCIAVAFVLHVFVSFGVLVKAGFHESAACFKQFVPDVLTAVVAGALAWWVGSLVTLGVFGSLVVKCLVGLVVFVVAYGTTGQLKFIKSMLKA